MTGDLVVISLESWDEVWRRNQYLVAGLLEADPQLRVLFVEPPADPLYDLRRRVAPQLGRRLRPVGAEECGASGRLWTLRQTKWLPRRLDPHGDERRARRARSAASQLGLIDPVLWVNDPVGAALLRVTGWAALYDITDDWLLAHRSTRQLIALRSHEEELFASCAEVVVCSPALAGSKGAIRPVTLVRNAVDVDRYRRPVARPGDLPPRSTVYVGTVHPDRIDVDLCIRVAERLSAMDAGELVLVGPVLLDPADTNRLTQAGVALLGPRPAAKVPAYLQHAAALLVPHIVDAFTDSLDPIKLYEYLAVGRPIVSTPVAGFRDQPAGRVTVADPVALPDALVAVLRQGPRATADDEVPRWSDRVREMSAVLNRVCATRPSPTPG